MCVQVVSYRSSISFLPVAVVGRERAGLVDACEDCAARTCAVAAHVLHEVCERVEPMVTHDHTPPAVSRISLVVGICAPLTDSDPRSPLERVAIKLLTLAALTERWAVRPSAAAHQMLALRSSPGRRAHAGAVIPQRRVSGGPGTKPDIRKGGAVIGQPTSSRAGRSLPHPPVESQAADPAS